MRVLFAGSGQEVRSERWGKRGRESARNGTLPICGAARFRGTTTISRRQVFRLTAPNEIRAAFPRRTAVAKMPGPLAVHGSGPVPDSHRLPFSSSRQSIRPRNLQETTVYRLPPASSSAGAVDGDGRFGYTRVGPNAFRAGSQLVRSEAAGTAPERFGSIRYEEAEAGESGRYSTMRPTRNPFGTSTAQVAEADGAGSYTCSQPACFF